MSYENEMRQLHDDYHNGRISTEEFSKRRHAISSKHDKNNSQPSPGMVNCSVCKKEIASRARVCPHCGEKRDNYERTSGEALGGCFAIMFVVTLGLSVTFPFVSAVIWTAYWPVILFLFIAVLVVVWASAKVKL